MEQTDASCERQILKEKIQHNNQQIQAIEVEDLTHLEQDLDHFEKVSLLFLLCASDPIRYKVMLQQLMVLSFDRFKPTEFLRSWALDNGGSNNSSNKWKDALLEALCIIQAKCIIRNLGLDLSDLEERYLSQSPHSALTIHPIVKLLYYICEQLTVDETKSLICHINQKHPSKSQNFTFGDNGEHLELYLMHWIWEGIIDIGQNESADQNERLKISLLPCNLEPIMLYLKQAEMDSLKTLIKDVTHQFNCKRIKEAGAPSDNPNKMQTDDKQATNLEATSRCFEERLRLGSGCDGDLKLAYGIRKESAGTVLIINQKRFYFDANSNLKEFLPKRRLETRHGTDCDADILKKAFSAFGYRVQLETDLMHSDILNVIRNAVNEGSRLDSIIVCILSHGYKGIVYGANSIPVKIEDIENLLISDRLIGKPKILIVQACQGEETQRAREIDYLRHDSPSLNSLPVYSDLLTCISTVPGFTSIRHTQEGSWFIQTLCKKLMELADRKHFIDILTVVCREVLNKRGRNNQCMVPIYHSTLRMDLYLPTK